ncbi:unnamed protein product [Pseudo-nitzschia multistriata]|uniref:Uncharacterized protein n=1 Tax=Pseudo-nitzschia multistriata TaxID=183589 RepID=A0A448ZD81_9STRA|nr:unnamed protein product [Pseudo-nitzschia multistriata]
MSEDVQFMPNSNLRPLRKPTRKLRKLESAEAEEEEGESTTGAWEAYDPYSVQPFVEGMSEYDEYQQAWRLLGFMIDCNMSDDDDNNGSGSGDTTEDGCARYVLWAAYVDLDYEGGGIGEYQYWDRDTESWDDTACYYADAGSGDGNNDGNDDANSKSRCAKMDCHLEDTNFSVLGFFKHRNYDDWMEQLFKHEGMCVWSDEEYAFMKNAREAWPQGCIDSGLTSEDGEYNLYYNIKPMRNGRIAPGFYTDTQCLDDYSVTTDEMEDMIGNIFFDGNGSGSQDENYDFSSESLSESLDRWNSAFDVWHTCHPCVAHDLENIYGDTYTDDGYNYNGNYNYGYRRRRKLGGEYSAQGDIFECYDDAGYTNVNQCMKFSAKTVMKTATFRDLSLARTQTTLVEYPLSGFLDASDRYHMNILGNFATYFCLCAVVLAFYYSLYNLYRVSKAAEAERQQGSNKDSLLTE